MFCSVEGISIFFIIGAASICEQNLMKTFKYGGRRTHPSPVELKQLVVSVLINHNREVKFDDEYEYE